MDDELTYHGHTVDDDLEAPPSPSNANATDRSGGNEKGGGERGREEGG